MMDDVIAQPQLVGRDRELSTLTDSLVLADATTLTGPSSGRSHVVLAGDAGVGKTRLLTELSGRAEEAGWQVFTGHCLDLGEGAPPYLPFVELLDRLVSTQPDVVEQTVAASPALGLLLPTRSANQRPAAGEADRASLFEGVRAALARAAEKAPVLVVVEDAHWAEQSTRDLLTYLFTVPFQAPVAVVVSYRSDDLHRRHPLRRQVTEWGRLPAVGRLSLDPLDDDAVRVLVTELDSRLAPGAREQIVRRAEGNAFFVEELVGAAGGPDHWVPEELADVLLVRLDRLSDAARDVVRQASVSGRRVEHEVLGAVTGLATDELETTVREAVEAHVLIPSERGYAFRHALLAEAVYDDLLPGERVRLHQRYVAALQQAPGHSAAELAHHARAAHDLVTAVAASIRAGDEASALRGPDEAAQHFQNALELVEDPDVAAGVDIDVPLVTLRAAEELLNAGRGERAAALLGERVEQLGQAGDPLTRARLLALRAMAMENLEVQDLPLVLSAEAVEVLPEDAPAHVRARVLATRAQLLADFGNSDEAEAVGLDALGVAEGHDLHRIGSEIITTLSGLRRRGPQQPLRESLQAAVERARESGSVRAELRGCYWIGRSYEDFARYEEAVSWFERGTSRGAEVGTPWAPFAADCRWRLLLIAVTLGDWDQVEELAGVERAPAIFRTLLETLRLYVRQARGDDVAEEARALRPWWPEEGSIALHSAPLEMVAAGRRGDPDGVLSAYDEVVAALGRIWHPGFSATIRFAAVAIGELTELLPDVSSARRGPLLARIEELYAEGARALREFEDPTGHWGPEGLAWSKRLDAETLRARWRAGVDVPPPEVLVETWQECVQLFEEYGHQYEIATSRTALAEVLRAGGDVAGAREQAGLAREIATRLGAGPLLERLRGLGSRPERERADRAGEALTPREAEILALVAEGRSNGEIGKQLFISTKTVSVHVSRILAKLGAAGRTEASALARRQGLLD